MLNFREKRRIEMEERLRISINKDKSDDSFALKAKRIVAYIVGSPVSWLSLFISVATAYLTIIRQNDDLRVIINKSPSLLIDIENKMIVVDGETSVAFVNNGNRGIFVQRLAIAFARQNPSRGGAIITNGCHGGYGAPLFYETAPFIVNKSDFSIKNMQIDKKQGITIPDKPNAKGLSFSFIEPRGGDRFAVCLRINFATPDKFIYEKDVTLFDGNLSDNLGSVWIGLPGDAAMTTPTDPLVIYKNTKILQIIDLF